MGVYRKRLPMTATAAAQAVHRIGLKHRIAEVPVSTFCARNSMRPAEVLPTTSFTRSRRK